MHLFLSSVIGTCSGVFLDLSDAFEFTFTLDTIWLVGLGYVGLVITRDNDDENWVRVLVGE